MELHNNKTRDRFYKQMSSEQHALFDSIQENIFTFCEAVAGSGKTTVSLASMLDLLVNGKIDNIVYIQKPSERYLSQGFLPGTLDEKSQLLFLPFYDAMATLGISEKQLDTYMKENKFILTTDCALRGINLEKSGIVVDEAENMDFHTLKLIFTRCHDNCHICMIGDRRQKDNHKSTEMFIAYGEYLASMKFGNKIELTRNYRGKFSKAAEAFEKNG